MSGKLPNLQSEKRGETLGEKGKGGLKVEIIQAFGGNGKVLLDSEQLKVREKTGDEYLGR